MSFSANQYRPAPLNLMPNQNGTYQLAAAINDLQGGKLLGVGEFTLTENVTSTTITDVRARANAVVLWTPTTANAAGAASTTYLSSITTNEFEISHANAATTDRTFRYIILG